MPYNNWSNNCLFSQKFKNKTMRVLRKHHCSKFMYIILYLQSFCFMVFIICLVTILKDMLVIFYGGLLCYYSNCYRNGWPLLYLIFLDYFSFFFVVYLRVSDVPGVVVFYLLGSMDLSIAESSGCGFDTVRWVRR